ncbi:drug/metabolite transporter (DMT)-like permease [Arthrobacter globiformis]|nr:drug/metabolite transporter (DMT)-like permease [Arthrobacter globiformis]
MPALNNRAHMTQTSSLRSASTRNAGSGMHAAAMAGTPAAVTAPASAKASGFVASGLGIALFSSAVFGLSGSFAKSLLETGWTPGAAVTARLTAAALILAIPAVPALRGRWTQLRSNWVTIVLFGLIGVAACQLFYFNAVDRLSVGVALLLEYLAPVLIVLWLWVASRKRPRPLTVAGTLLSLGGLVLVLDLTGAVKIDAVGVFWGLAAAVCLAMYFFITAKQNDTLPPIVLASGGLLVGAAVMWLTAATGLLPMAISTADTKLGPWTTPWWVPLGGLVLLATVLAYVSGIMAARALGSKVASFVSLTEVLFAVIWAWLLLGELPGPIQLLGGVLIVGGVLFVRLDELRGAKAEDQAAVTGPLDLANDVEPVP